MLKAIYCYSERSGGRTEMNEESAWQQRLWGSKDGFGRCTGSFYRFSRSLY